MGLYHKWCIWMFMQGHWTIWNIPKKYRTDDLFRIDKLRRLDHQYTVGLEEKQLWIQAFYDGYCKYQSLPFYFQNRDLWFVGFQRGDFPSTEVFLD